MSKSLLFHKTPLLAPTLCLMAGIFCHTATPPMHLLMLAAIALLAGMQIIWKNRLLFRILLYCYCFFLGSIITHKKLSDFYAFFTKNGSHLTLLTATVSDMEENKHAYYNYKTVLYIHTAISENGHQSHDFYANWYHASKPRYVIGDKLELENTKIHKLSPKNDYSLYLCKENIQLSLFGTQQITSITPATSLPLSTNMLLVARNMIFATKTSLMTPESTALFSSLFLGNKTLLKSDLPDIQHDFNTWGIAHHLARSGLHLVLFVALWGYVLRCIPIHFFIKQIIALVLVLGYCFLSWSSISFVRALCLFILHRIGILAGLRMHIASILPLTTLVILLHNPLHLYFLDFQLSFSLTYALAWITAYKNR